MPNKRKPPIKYWSYSSLMAFLRNPLAWHKRYVEEIYDTPRTPASIVGSAGHLALENFYRNSSSAKASEYKKENKETSIQKGLDYLRAISDSDIDFGKIRTRKAKKEKRLAMEREYLQAISFYLKQPPRHKILGVEVKGVVDVDGLDLPIKAISDLVVESRTQKGAVDIVDHKFVVSFSKGGAEKTLFVLQAIFNYYIVKELFGKPVRKFIVYECKKTKNSDGKKQLRRYEIDFSKCEEYFAVFHRLLNDTTEEISRRRIYLPNPSDMFEGENSFDIYRLGLVDDETVESA
jgi:hypothetical protein